MAFDFSRRRLSEFGNTVYEELLRTRVFTIAAAMAFYFFLALFPLLILFSSLLGYLPGHDVFDSMLALLRMLVPADAMDLVQKFVTGVVTPHRGGLLSFGVLGYLWAATGGFAAAIEALDVAYDVPVSRSWWRDRIQALLLTFTSGLLVSVSLVTLMVGPIVLRLMDRVVHVPPKVYFVWPSVHLVFTVVTFILGVELLYYLGPNTKRSFLSTFPGAIFAVVCWFGWSACLNFYISHFAHYNRMYGSLGAVIALMLWFYLIALAILIGAEMNAELWKRRHKLREDDPMNRAIPGIPNA